MNKEQEETQFISLDLKFIFLKRLKAAKEGIAIKGETVYIKNGRLAKKENLVANTNTPAATMKNVIKPTRQIIKLTFLLLHKSM